MTFFPLSGAALEQNKEVGWDDDDDDDSESPTPQPRLSTSTPKSVPTAKDGQGSSGGALLKPVEPRKSQDEKSQADSDASYDLVSGATTGAPGTPKDGKDKEKKGKKDESDEEDWE